MALSQTTKLDSLETALKNAASDSMRVRALKDIAWQHLNQRNDNVLAKTYIDSFYHISKASEFDWGVYIANYQYCVLERQKGNYKTALNHIEDALLFVQASTDTSAITNTLYQKALILDDWGRNEESLKIYYDILDFYERTEDHFSVATTHNAIGEVLKKGGKFEKALESYHKALTTFENLEDKIEMANCNYNIGDTFLQIKSYDQALVYFKKALALDTEIGSKWGMAYDYESLGKVLGLKGDYRSALNYHERALKIRETLNHRRELSMSYLEIGKSHYSLKNYDKAEDFLTKALAISKEVGDKDKMRVNYDLLAKLYNAKGDYKNAFDNSLKLIAVKDSLYNRTKSQQIEELQAKFDSEKKQNEIQTLEKDAQIKDLKLKRQSTLRNIIIGIALGIISLFFIVLKRFQYRQKLKEEALIKEQLLAKAETERERRKELQKIDKLKDEFLANTSHELRTPLNGIIGLSESLKDGVAGKLSNKAIENLDMIVNSSKRLSNLVNDILDFSKLKNKDLALSIQPVDLYPVVNLVLKLSEVFVKDKPVKLINSIARDLPLVQADEDRLQQILFNLIGNAIKFTERGHVEIKAEYNAGSLIVSVIDTGIGIPEDKMDVIFKSFEQVDGSTERKYGGTGLGLPVTKQLVELHGGTIEVSSKLNSGSGSKFSFSLPLSDKKRTDISQNTNIPSEVHVQSLDNNDSKLTNVQLHPPKSGITVLIVDDEPINRRVLENHLTVAGYGVHEVGSGKEALELIDQGHKFDLILLDIMMPNMSGYEVCQTIRKNYLTSELPIVLLTAKNRVSDLVTGFNVGANDYLTKPFSKNELLSRIKTHLSLYGIHKATSKFVPYEFLRSVGREAITDVVLGDHIEKEITVLFTDIRDYTGLAESMTPEENFKFVNAYVGRMGPIIQKYNGFVNQYLGDGIMALFPDKAQDALQACIDMHKAVQLYNAERENEGFNAIHVGMGLHTGQLVMGIIGDPHRNDTAIIADTVNTASRMEGVTKYYGANIIISEASINTIPDKANFNFRFLGKVMVKGKRQIMGIYECFDGDTKEQIALKMKTIRDFEKGLKHFLNKEFPKASAMFDKVLNKNPNDQVARYFMTKSAEYTISGVPKDWEVINKMEVK